MDMTLLEDKSTDKLEEVDGIEKDILASSWI